MTEELPTQLKRWAEAEGALRSRLGWNNRNNLTAHLAELLAQRALSLTPAPTNVKAYDCFDPATQKKVQVKGVRPTETNKSRQLSALRSWEFDDLVVVVFSSDYTVFRAARIAAEKARLKARRSEHVRGDILRANDDFLSLGKDVTLAFQQAWQEL